MIDEDDRHLRNLKEIYLQDGDLHSEGGGRMRRFKWANLGMLFSYENWGEYLAARVNLLLLGQFGFSKSCLHPQINLETV